MKATGYNFWSIQHPAICDELSVRTFAYESYASLLVSIAIETLHWIAARSGDLEPPPGLTAIYERAAPFSIGEI